MGEPDVTCFLGEMDLHDAVGERVDATAAHDALLDVVDGLLSSEDDLKEETGPQRSERTDEGEGLDKPRWGTVYLRSHAVGELLKHLDVVCLFGEFVHEVAEFGVFVRQAHQELGSAEKE